MDAAQHLHDQQHGQSTINENQIEHGQPTTREQEVEQEEGGMCDLDTQQQQQQMTDSGSVQQQELEDNNAASGNTGTNTADKDERYVGMILCKADRANLADCLHQKAPKKRKKGSFCPHPKLAADSFTMKKLHNAFKAVADAADAMYVLP